MSNQRDPNKRQIGGYVSKELKRQIMEVAKRRSLSEGRDVPLIEVIVDYLQTGLSEEASKTVSSDPVKKLAENIVVSTASSVRKRKRGS